MLAQRKEVNGSLHYLAQTTIRPTATFGLEGCEQFGIALITFGRIEHGAQKTLWCLVRGRGVQDEAKSVEYFGYVPFIGAELLFCYMTTMQVHRCREFLLVRIELKIKRHHSISFPWIGSTTYIIHPIYHRRDLHR